jgi:hypothetical protein
MLIEFQTVRGLDTARRQTMTEWVAQHGSKGWLAGRREAGDDGVRHVRLDPDWLDRVTEVEPEERPIRTKAGSGHVAA